MEIQVIEKTIVQKWMKDDKYNFEVPLGDIWIFLNHVLSNSLVNEYEIHEFADKSMIPYFIDNKILYNANGDYVPALNFTKFSDLIWNKLHE